jgi:hypothetical protein
LDSSLTYAASDGFSDDELTFAGEQIFAIYDAEEASNVDSETR